MDFLIRPELDSRRDFIKKAAGPEQLMIVAIETGQCRAFRKRTGRPRHGQRVFENQAIAEK